MSLPSLVLLPTFPPSWLLLRSQVLCHPAGKASDCFDFPSPSSPALLGFFERLYLSAPMNGRSPERIIRGENIYILGENLLLHSFPMGRNGLCLVSAMVNHVGCLNQSILQAACVWGHISSEWVRKGFLDSLGKWIHQCFASKCKQPPFPGVYRDTSACTGDWNTASSRDWRSLTAAIRGIKNEERFSGLIHPWVSLSDIPRKHLLMNTFFLLLLTALFSAKSLLSGNFTWILFWALNPDENQWDKLMLPHLMGTQNVHPPDLFMSRHPRNWCHEPSSLGIMATLSQILLSFRGLSAWIPWSHRDSG